MFDANRLDAQCFATLLYYTIAIQLHYYKTTTLLPLYYTTTTLVLHWLRYVLLHTLAALRQYYYTTSMLRVNSHQTHATLLHQCFNISQHCHTTTTQHCCTTGHTTATQLPGITAPCSWHFTLYYSPQDWT